jgi:hypothetical protein
LGISGNERAREQEEVKWLTIVQQSFRDVILMGFGAWIIWKQVYAQNPNGYLAIIGFACMVPSARAAIIAILSEHGPSSPSPPPPQLPPPPSSPPGGTGERT